MARQIPAVVVVVQVRILPKVPLVETAALVW
jgi:hypothetical protein